MSDYIFVEYPKVLYKARATKTVDTEADEKAAVKDGWKTADKRGPEELPEEFEAVQTAPEGEPA